MSYLNKLFISEAKGALMARTMSPLILYADKAAEYNTDPLWGDQALKAIQEGRKILVRIPNADGQKFTAIYSPVLTYQLPNYENNYLYLFYLRDEKQDIDLSAVGLGIVKTPLYGELQMMLSEKYNGSPLEDSQNLLLKDKDGVLLKTADGFYLAVDK